MKLSFKSYLFLLSGIQCLNIIDDVLIPAKKLEVPWNIPNDGPGPVYDNFINAIISLCSIPRFESERCVCPEKYSNLHQIHDKEEDTYVVIATDNSRKQLVVSYRSTLSIKNILTDLNVPLVRAPGLPKDILVHKGFLDYFTSTHTEAKGIVHSILKNKRYSNYTLHASGYSLGSAIATLSAPYWLKFLKTNNFPNSFQAYGYGGPRVGNAQFAQFIADLDVPIIRYSNQNDIVTNTPPRILGYRHAGLEFHLQPKGLLGPYHVEQCSQRYDEDPNCGLTETPISPSHLAPFNTFIPPPYC